MKIIIYWEKEKRASLVKTINISLEELGLTDFIKLEETFEKSIKEDMWIKETPALIIEEESIDFKDIIFEGQNPPEDEIKAMIISIVGWESGDSCATDACWSCSSASVCGV